MWTIFSATSFSLSKLSGPKHGGGSQETLGSLSSDVFERRTSTGSEVFSLLTCLDDIKFVFLSFFTVIEAIWLKICAKPPSKIKKGHFRLTCVAQKRCCLSSLLAKDARDFQIIQSENGPRTFPASAPKKAPRGRTLTFQITITSNQYFVEER